MRKLLLMFLFVALLIIPFRINAKSEASYSEGKTYANNYIGQFRDYYLYVTHRDAQNLFEFNESNKKPALNSEFRNGGFLNKLEFDIAGGENSYLYDGQKYWTMTKSGSNIYAIDGTPNDYYSAHPEDYLTGVRVTQFIRNGVKIDGAGTYVNPWKFELVEKSYTIKITVKDENNVKLTGLEKEYTKDFEENFTDTYELPRNKTAEGYVLDCTTGTKSNVRAQSQKFENYLVGGELQVSIENIMEDYVCSIQVHPRTYNVEFTSITGGTISPTGRQTVVHGNNLEYTVTANTGYTTAGATCTCGTSCSISENKMTVTNVTADALTCSINFKPSVYTVTFNVNGGVAFNATTCPSSTYTLSGTTCSKKVTSGSAYGILPTVTKSNVCNDFAGWYTAATGGTQVIASTISALTANQTLYARWSNNVNNGTWGACAGGSCSGCNAVANSGTQTNTCGGTRACTPSNNICKSNGTWGTCSGGTCNGCNVTANSGSQTNTCGATRACTPSKDCTANGTWGSCNLTYKSGNYAYGTRRNSCGKTEECSAYCSFTGYSYSNYSCGTEYANYNCGGTTFRQSTGYSEPCISRPTGCSITMSPSRFKYGTVNDVTFYGTAYGTTSIDSCSFSGLKRYSGCSASGTRANPLGFTIGVYCDGISSSRKTNCNWYGTNYVNLSVGNSAGSSSCSKSYSVY